MDNLGVSGKSLHGLWEGNPAFQTAGRVRKQPGAEAFNGTPGHLCHPGEKRKNRKKTTKNQVKSIGAKGQFMQETVELILTVRGQGFPVQMGKLQKRHPLSVTEYRATTSELGHWAVNCQRLRDYPGEIAQYAWNTRIFCSCFLLLFFCFWSLLENIWQQLVLLFLQSYVKLTKAKRKCMQAEIVTLPKLQPNKRE